MAPIDTVSIWHSSHQPNHAAALREATVSMPDRSDAAQPDIGEKSNSKRIDTYDPKRRASARTMAITPHNSANAHSPYELKARRVFPLLRREMMRKFKSGTH